jgi:hypothetical protein
MERSLSGVLLLVAGIAISLSAGAWWMQRIAFTPDSTRGAAAAMLSEPDIRIEINTVVAGATAPVLGVGVGELGRFLEEEILSTRAGAAMMGPIMEEAHDRIIGNRDDEPVQLTGTQMIDIVRDERAADAPTVTLPLAPIGALNTIKVAVRWIIPISAAIGLIALVLAVITRPDRREVRRGLGEFGVALAASMLLFGYLLPVHLLTAIDNRTWTHAIPQLALRTLPVVLGATVVFTVGGLAMIMASISMNRRRQSSTPIAASRYRSGGDRDWS